MPVFSYSAYDATGELRQGTVEAADAATAHGQLGRAGVRAFALEEDKRAAMRRFVGLRGSPVSDKVIHRFFGDLTDLLEAGFRPREAIAVIRSASTGALHKFVSTLAERLDAGEPFSRALEQTAHERPRLVALVAVGERAGNLATIARSIADTFETDFKRRKQLAEALAYPVFLLLMIMFALVFLALVLVPALQPVFEAAAIETPAGLRILSAVHGALTGGGWLLPVILGGVGIVVLLFRRSGDRIIEVGASRSKLVARLFHGRDLIAFCEALALLVGGGVDVPEALRLSAPACRSRAVKAGILRARTDLTAGKGLADALRTALPLDETALGLIRIGAESNQLPVVLRRVAAAGTAARDAWIRRGLAILTPTVTILMGLFIGGLIVSVMGALLSLNDLAIAR